MQVETSKRTTGVRYLDTTDPDKPTVRKQRSTYVIVSGGAVQSARLLLLSGPPEGLGNSGDQAGRYAQFHSPRGLDLRSFCVVARPS